MHYRNKKVLPPKLAQSFLYWFLRSELAEEVCGDLEEQFITKLGQASPFQAKLDYWFQVLNYLRPFAVRHFNLSQLISFFMFRHHLKIGFRTLVRDRGYTFINIGGLALGMCVTLLIGLWIWDEMNYNKSHDNYDRVAAVLQNQTFNGEVETWRSQARQLGTLLRDEYGAHFKHVVKSSFVRDMLMEVGDKKIDIKGHYMEAGAPDLLSLDMVHGTRDGLQDPNSIFLAKSVATALFGSEDPLHKTIKIGNAVDLQVSGVYDDFPFNSSFYKTEWLAPWEFFMKRFDIRERSGWGNSWFQTFVQIGDQANMAEVSASIKDAKLKAVSETDDARFKPEIFLHPMSDWHLRSEFKNGKCVGGRIQYVWMFGIIGIFVLLLACINFVNLSTARSERRAREVGVRKAIGSVRGQLMGQFFSESFLVTFIAFVLALLVVQIALPGFNLLADKEISQPWNQPLFWMACSVFCLLTGLLSGIYPALYLSSFQPVKVLTGTFRTGRSAALPRKALVVLQFSVSVALIIGTLIVFQQIQHVKNRPIGYNNNNLVTAWIHTDKMKDQFDFFRNDLLRTGAVEEVAISNSPITDTGVTNSGFNWSGKDPNMTEEFVTLRISHEYGKVINWKIKQGRDFSREMSTDSSGFIINEAAAKYMGMEDPIGQTVDWEGNKAYQVIGVVKDLVTQSPYRPVKQTIFFLDYERAYCTNIRVKPAANMSEALGAIESVFKKYDPVNIFDYSFADEDYAEKFSSEVRVGKLAGLFTLLAILISCLGIFGLAAYVAERRTKEIGIRKVLGASVPQLWQLLSKEFILLVMIACLAAVPVAYYFLNGWLQNYEYRTSISGWVFVAAGLGAVLITFFTVSFQAVRAALANPVDALRGE